MARIGILTCSNATQDLGCSSVVCLADFRKRKGAFADYPPEEYRERVGKLFCQPRKTMVDIILDRDGDNRGGR